MALKKVAAKAAAKPAAKPAPTKPPAKAAVSAKGARAPAAKVAKVAPAPTITLKHLAASLAEKHDHPKKQVDTMLTDMVGVVVDHLKKGDRIRIGGLGILEVKKRAARMGRNPATGEAMQIKASKKVAFRAAKELKEAV